MPTVFWAQHIKAEPNLPFHCLILPRFINGTRKKYKAGKTKQNGYNGGGAHLKKYSFITGLTERVFKLLNGEVWP